MGQFPKSGYPELTIGLVSTFDVWCMGMERIIEHWGWAIAGRWRCWSDAFPPGKSQQELPNFDVAIVASQLLDRPDGAGLFRPFESHYSGRMIVSIEPGDAFSLQDFLMFDVDGLLLSAASVEQVIDCIETVGRAGRWVDPGIRALLAPQPAHGAEHAGLSSREMQIARLAASGLSNKHIARELGISDGTVKMHMHHILAKLNVGSRFNLGQIDWLQGDPRTNAIVRPIRLARQANETEQIQY